MCIDNACKKVPIVSQMLIPIPFCNPNGTLLGNGSFAGVLDYFKEDASIAAVDLVLNSLGVKVGFKKFLCCIP